MLERIHLRNFKAARDLDVRLRPLTVLAGLNGSGKSSVLQTLSVLRQSYRGGQAMGLLLGGPLVQLGQGRDVRSDGADDDTIAVTVNETGSDFYWACTCIPTANQLDFDEQPPNPPGFITSRSFQYLQADRIVPRTLYPQSSQQARDDGFLGAHGEFTADFLALRQDQDVSEKRRYKSDRQSLDPILWAKIAPTAKLLDQVAGWLQELSPGARLVSERVKGTDEVILQFNYVGHARGLETGPYRPTNVGFGLTYCLPIVVACLSAPNGSLLLLENPEAHLHPQGQAALGELLCLCAADGAQIIVETHSDHLLNGIRLGVKSKHIEPDYVQLHYFTRQLLTGDCSIESPAILPDGQLSNWPKGFFDQWERSLDALLD